MCWRNGVETNFKTRVLKFSLSKNYAMKTLETRYLGPILWGKDCHES